MFTHVMVGSNDLARSRAFYDALFATIGGTPAVEDENGHGELLRVGSDGLGAGGTWTGSGPFQGTGPRGPDLDRPVTGLTRRGAR